MVGVRLGVVGFGEEFGFGIKCSGYVWWGGLGREVM